MYTSLFNVEARLHPQLPTKGRSYPAYNIRLCKGKAFVFIPRLILLPIS